MHLAGLSDPYPQGCCVGEHVRFQNRDADANRSIETQAAYCHTFGQGFYQLDVAVSSYPVDGCHHILVTHDTIEIVAVLNRCDFQFDVNDDTLYAAAFMLMNTNEALQFQAPDE